MGSLADRIGTSQNRPRHFSESEWIRLYGVALTWTDDPKRAKEMVNAYFRGLYDHQADWEDGYWDAFHGFPRKSTRPWYRAGYDSGLTDVLHNRVPEVEENREEG